MTNAAGDHGTVGDDGTAGEPTTVVRVSTRDRVATITIDRPEVRNALSSAVLAGLAVAVHACEADPEVDVMILTGADPAFCAGLDLAELAAGQLELAFVVARDAPPWEQGPLPPRDKPLIGAVNGAAVTGGLELALLCDFLVASDRARFADTHSRVGILPGWGLTVMLPQAVGLRRAREMSATGNYVDATTALEWGLVNHVVPHDELLEFCGQLAGDICSNDSAAVQRLFRSYAEGARVSGAEAWAIEADAGREWRRGGGGSLDEVDRRRREVIDRGRSQSSD